MLLFRMIEINQIIIIMAIEIWLSRLSHNFLNIIKYPTCLP